MLKVYGADICCDCLAAKKIFAEQQVDYEYIDIIKNTDNMKAFFVIRDHSPLFEAVRNREGGGIGVPLFVKAERMTMDLNEVLQWEGKQPVSEEEYEQLAAAMKAMIASGQTKE